ncbi:MAG: PQQ-binding-like beta-propeller repeat protein [Thermoplasmata archaeon]|nr:PQQ-binding-like beta-propeller repeat protein [Thermoplasmata archaeon]
MTAWDVRRRVAPAVALALVVVLASSVGGPFAAGLPIRTTGHGSAVEFKLGLTPRVPAALERWAPSAASVASTDAVPAPIGTWSTYEFAANRSGYNFDEHTLSPQNAPELRVAWNVSLPGPIFASPTVVNGTVYVGSWDGFETALFASNGTVIWNTFLGQENFTGQGYGCPWANPLGVTSAATVVGDTVFVGGATQYFALNATTGAQLWNYSEGAASNGYYAWSSPLYYEGNVYVGIASQCDNPLLDGGLLELSATTGSVVHHLDTAGGGQGGSIWSSPTVDAANNTVWVTTGNGPYGSGSYGQAVVAVNATTLQVKGSWQAPAGPNDIDFGAGGTLFTSSGGGLGVVATNKDGWAYALNRSNLGAGPLWSDQTTTFPGDPSCQPPGFSIAPAAFDGTSVYLPSSYTTINAVAENGSVRAADPSNGTYRWQTPAPGTIRGGLVSANGLVVDISELLPYTVAGTCASYSAENRSWLQVLNATDGHPLYSFFAPYAFAVAPSIADGRIFVGAGTADESEWTALPNHEGHLYAFGVPLSASVSVFAGAPANRMVGYLLNATPAGGMPGYSCVWSSSGVATGSSCHLAATFPFGDHPLQVTVRDAANETWNATVWANSSASALAVALSITPPTIVRGSPVDFFATVSSGLGPYSYVFSGLPLGCVSENVTSLRCTPGQVGNFSVGVTVTDSLGAVGGALANLTVTAPRPPPPAIFGFAVAPAVIEVGTEIQISAVVTGGASPLVESIGGLPTGCDSSGSLNLSCTPSAPGNFSVTGSVVDSLGRGAEVSATLVVVPRLSVAGFTATPSTASVGSGVHFDLALTGGESPFTVNVVGLPAGCPSGNSTSFSCTPTSAGSYRVTADVTDALGDSGNGTVTLVVTATSGGGAGVNGTIWSFWLTWLGIGVAAAAVVGVAVMIRRSRSPGSPEPGRSDPSAGRR